MEPLLQNLRAAPCKMPIARDVSHRHGASNVEQLGAYDEGLVERNPFRGGVGLSIVSGHRETGFSYNYVASLVLGLIGLAISGIYFVYTWTAMRATIGMRVLGISCVTNAAAGVLDKKLDHAEVLAAGESMEGTLTELLRRIVPKLVAE
mgnify:CR=1 FL=1